MPNFTNIFSAKQLATTTAKSSLAINLDANSNNACLCQFVMNNDDALITGGGTTICSLGQLYTFGPYVTNNVGVNIEGNGTSLLSSTRLFAYSDYRLKHNVKSLDETYTIDNIRPVEYNLRLEPDAKKHFGVIAHELAEIYPNLVNGEKDADKMQQVNYIELIPLIINEVQIMKKKYNELEIEIENESY